MKKWLLLIIFSCLAGAGLVISGILKNQNREVTALPNRADRIVSLAPNITEILFALGLGDKVVAVSAGSNYPSGATNIKKVGSFWGPNIEEIIASKPDLVITLWFEQQRAIADSLNRLGYQVLTLRIEKIEELLEAIRKIGTATDCKQQADKLVENIENELNDIKLQLSSANKVKVLWVVQTEPLRLAGRGTFVNELIEYAGGENAVGTTIQKYPQIGTEELLACGPEVIIQSAMGTERIAEQQQAAETFWHRWANLPAVKNNRIYVVNPDTVLRLSPRLPQGIRLIASYLHPDIFPQRQSTAEQIR